MRTLFHITFLHFNAFYTHATQTQTQTQPSSSVFFIIIRKRRNKKKSNKKQIQPLSDPLLLFGMLPRSVNPTGHTTQAHTFINTNLLPGDYKDVGDEAKMTLNYSLYNLEKKKKSNTCWVLSYIILSMNNVGYLSSRWCLF